jgi:UDP-N-acetylglucosamine acyltransferase
MIMSGPGPSVHPTAVVNPQAELSDDTFIGPFCTIGPDVGIGPGCRFDAHVVVEGPTVIGADNRFYPFTTIGTPPQDLKYGGEETLLEIGSHNVFREYANVNRGTAGGGGTTRIGDHGYFMVYAHVAHDCILGDHVMMANAATLGGHVVVEDYGTIGAFSGVHPFCRIGIHGWVGGYTVVTKDVLPYSRTVTPRHTRAYGVNKLGLERRGFAPDRIAAIERAFRVLQRSGLNTRQALEAIQRDVASDDVRVLVDFIERSERGVHK